MTEERKSLPGQPLIAILCGIACIVGLAASWWVTFVYRSGEPDPGATLLLLCLMAALILTYHFPIHVSHASKIYISGIVLFLMAALLPVATAATTIAVGILAGELSACRRTGNHRIVTIIPTQVFRWGIIGLCASLVAHVPTSMQLIPLAVAGTVLWLGDILTGPLLLSPVLHQGPLPVMRMMVREGGMAEAAQYLIGMLGAIEAVRQPLALLLLALPAALIYMSFARARRVDSETRRVLEDMADTVDRKDGFAADHSRRVAELTQELLHAMGKYGPEADLIVFAARVHDIGHIAIPDEVLRKPGSLTPAETAILQTHVEKGEELLARYPDFARGASIIRHHHEAWDGMGYPDGLRGSEIPLGARVIAVADSFDAMTHDRPFRLRMTPGQAAALLRQGLGRQWDPDAVEALLRILGSEIEESTGSRLRLVHANEQDTG